MTNIKGRILQLADILGIGRKKFTEQIGMAYSSFTGRAKNTPLNSNAITNILTMFPNVNAKWLFTGEGEALLPAAGGNQSEYQMSGQAGSFQVSDVGGGYSVAGGAQNINLYDVLLDERKMHDEIVLSQQRTIELLVNKIK